jgi:broad specificity phosphatase PhoE
MKVRLYLVRHGQTVANAERRFQGHKDFPLSDFGKEQVQRVADRLQDVPLDFIYTSDLGRAITTAEAIAQRHSKPVVQNPIFREYSWGAFDGRTLEEAEELYPHLVKRNVEDWSTIDIPNKEVYRDFLNRADLGLKKLFDNHMGKRVLLVSHGRYLNAFMTRILRLKDEGSWAFSFVNTSVTVVDFLHNRKPKIRLFNDTNHLMDIDGYEDLMR